MAENLTGRINGWRCQACGAVTYCVHVDHGVTPMFLGCRVTDGCEGMAVSLMYPAAAPPAHVVWAVEWEWYRPTDKQARRMERKSPGMLDHVRQGGLALRPLTDTGRELLRDREATRS